MKFSVKSIARPFIRKTISLVEPVVGFRTDPTGHVPNRLKMLFGCYEKFLTRSICQVLPKNGVFVDIGANVGFFAHRIARQFQNVKVFAFEPNPRIYPILRENLKAFPNGESFQLGLGATEGVLDFYHGADSCVGSFVHEYTSLHPANQLKGHIEKSNVRVVTGDAVLSHMEIVDVMKIDVEGYETEAFKGMEKLLKRRAIKTIFFEFFPFAQRSARTQPEEIIRLLSESNYQIHEVEGERKGSIVCAENITALIARLGERGYTTLRATAR